MAETVPIRIEVEARQGFTISLVLPLDLTPREAFRVKQVIDEHTTDSSDAAKFAVCDPAISIGITE